MQKNGFYFIVSILDIETEISCVGDFYDMTTSAHANSDQKKRDKNVWEEL